MVQTQGLTAKGVPPQPVFLFWIKIAILVLSVVVLALAAWSISIFGGYGGYGYGGGAGAFMIFVTILTFIVYGGALGIELKASHLFYRIAALVLYGLSLIFWLSGWAYSASSAAAWMSIGWFSDTNNIGAALAACAGIGALVWILTIVHFIFFIRACLSDPNGSSSPGQAELGGVKHQDPAVQNYPTPVQPYPPQAYPVQQQQPYVAQQPYATQ